MVSFVPYYKKEREKVVIRIIVDRQVAKVISTGIKISKDQWDEQERKIVRHPHKKILNQKIELKIGELRSEIYRAELLGVQLTSSRVKKIAEGNAITTDFYKHCEQWIKDKYANPGTRNAAMSDLRKVRKYAPSLQFGDIDKRWLTKYERYLREDLKNEGNTPWKAMKFIRTMLYDAQGVGGIVHRNPFEEGEYKMPAYIQPEKDGLYLEEIDKIEKILTEPHPVIIKLMAARFLFMCYTGMRISDAKRFNPDQHLQNGERIIFKSKKTGAKTDLKIHDRLRVILNHLQVLPRKTLSDQKFNEYLKIIAELAGITRLTISTHVGRHTFSCLCAELGLSEEEAQQLMGHKNKNVTRVYYKLRRPQMDKAAEKFNKL